MKRHFVILTAVVILAAVLRFYNLASIPSSLTHDETILGYTSYSLLKTGEDLRGHIFPISIKTFGDYTLIGYPAVTMISIVLFGLNEFAVRSPSALAGTIQVILLYFLAGYIFKNKYIGLTAALFLAVSPWSIYFSRIAYEVNLGLTFFLGGLLLFIKYFQEKRKKQWWIGSSVFLFGLSQITYYSFILFVPLFVCIVLIYYRKFLTVSSSLVSAALIFFLFTTVTIYVTFLGGISEFKSVGIFNDRGTIYSRAELFRSDNSHESVLFTHLHNKYLGVTYQIAQNYISTFNTTFLFDKGGEAVLSSLGYFGQLYLIDALFLFCGVCFLFWNREKQIPILLIWLILGPISSAITKDAPSASRLYLMVPLFMLISAYGAFQLLALFLAKPRYGKVIVLLIFGLFSLNVLFFIEGYFGHIDVLRGGFLHYGYKQAVEVANKYPNDKVVMVGPDNHPYISFLFYNTYDPSLFRKQVKYYPTNSEGFDYVKSFGKYSFVERIDRNNLQKNIIYIDSYHKGDETNIIKLPSGDPLFTYFTAN